jgi:uncharacterized protein GlcG (DUF336 family)
MKQRRKLGLESLEQRQLLASDCGWHNSTLPEDVDGDSVVAPLDALKIIARLSSNQSRDLCAEQGSGEDRTLVDVNNSGMVEPIDVLLVISKLAKTTTLLTPAALKSYETDFSVEDSLGPQNQLTADEVETLLDRASRVSSSRDAIIAVVDRSGRILGVRVEDQVSPSLTSNADTLAFAIDGAVAKARTAAFFSNNAAPLTSRTIRYISQSTVTQREVQSSPLNANELYRGPGFVAPIGVGGHFPPEVASTPQVDLFAIEHQSRDSQRLSGSDAIRGNADDQFLTNRFNVDSRFIPTEARTFFETWPESYGQVTETSPGSQARGIATLPGGIPLFKVVTDAHGVVQKRPNKKLDLPDVNLVGGIGVFFPGTDGFATYEQGFVHSSSGVQQTESQRVNASRVLESEAIAFVAAAGGGVVGPSAFVRNLSDLNAKLPPLKNFVLPVGRIDLVGITLEIYGPTPTAAKPTPGIDQLLAVARTNIAATASPSGTDLPVNSSLDLYLAGQPVPEKWLVKPHTSQDGSISAAQVEQIIQQGIAQAELTRAAIRLDLDKGFTPGSRTRMVLSVAGKHGEVLGIYRMPDATVFSIDVSVAKARNTAYYADASNLQSADRVDFNADGVFGAVTTSLVGGDTLPLGTALTNRTFRFLVEPRYPTGVNLPANASQGLVNHPALELVDQRPDIAKIVGPQSILQLPGINPLNAENLDNLNPLSFNVYADPGSRSTLAFDAFNPSRNFRDPGDGGLLIANGTNVDSNFNPFANQNGVVFFPGSTPLYVGNTTLVGGFGVSGDGVDQDDVVTAAGQVGFAAPDTIRVDKYSIGSVRLPFQKYNRNPNGA